ncbi:MAG: dihydroneopterin aldolase [Nitrospiraceae bacterium]|nr:dihydroneopterin aldolase [Nitrospiraceae bacterium]
MSKTVFFEQLSIHVRIGTGQEERSRPQRLLLSGEIELSEISWGNDAIHKTVDYDRLLREIVAKGEASEFFLLERLGEAIVDHVMGIFPGVAGMTLFLWKDPAPLPLSLGRVGLKVRETRPRWEDRMRQEEGNEKNQEGPE